MRASSQAAMAGVIMATDRALDALKDPEASYKVASEFFELEDMTASDARFTRALTDPSRSLQDRQNLARSLLSKKMSPITVEAVVGLLQGRWPREEDFSKGLEVLAIHTLLHSADSSGVLDEVERNVFSVSQLLNRYRELRGALVESHFDNADERVTLITNLVGEQIHPIAMELVSHAVRTAKAGRLQSELRSMCDVAASVRNRRMATITSAFELTEGQIERISKALTQKLGTQMVINVVVDPSIVGGLKMRFGDQIVDGSIHTSLNNTRRRLAG
ncbi:MAG: F0F1 ATP synthase subunit delta [Actinomycetaceae bacterium]|nr:F0F1 ATP synthase subunit delta [Actinomycetaceae bacterium]